MTLVSVITQVTELSWRQLVRSKQLIGIGLAVLFAGGLAFILHQNDGGASAATFQMTQFFVLSAVVVPLIALLLGTGAMASERESGTLVYLFTRPIPRWAVVMGKALGAILVANLAVLLCVVVTFLASGAPARGAPLGGAGALMLEATALTALFTLFGTLMARSLYAGLAYVALFEGVLGNMVGPRAGWTITFHGRNLLSEWSGGSLAVANIGQLPGTAFSSVVILLGVTFGALALAGIWVETREYGLRDRVKEE